MKSVFFLLTFISLLEASPPKRIPPRFKNAFTLDGAIPVSSYYLNDMESKSRHHTAENISSLIKKADRRECYYYGETDTYLYQALDLLGKTLKNKRVGIIGSVVPWYESIILSYGGNPTVIEYTPITTDDPRITYTTPDEFARNPTPFDLILSISSTEHDGLGRYGDPIDPEGDLKSMDNFRKWLKPGGKLLLAVPIGQDLLVWNAHRIYGPKRLKLLFRGWRPLHYFGFSFDLFEKPLSSFSQPVILLEPK